MPGMDGYEIARRVRCHPRLGKVRLIAITGYGQIEDMGRSQLAGFDHHLVKPADLRTVQELLADLKVRKAAAE